MLTLGGETVVGPGLAAVGVTRAADARAASGIRRVLGLWGGEEFMENWGDGWWWRWRERWWLRWVLGLVVVGEEGLRGGGRWVREEKRESHFVSH